MSTPAPSIVVPFDLFGNVPGTREVKPASPEGLVRGAAATGHLMQSLGSLGLEHGKRIAETYGALATTHSERARAVWSVPRPMPQFVQDWVEYVQDAAQRGILFLDAMRQVGNHMVEQQKNGNKPVLVYDYELIVDGRDLPRPVNYMLLRILPKPGTTADPAAQPYMIIDPRAGHGPGIGGSKGDSEVGVALAHGHPVYFVVFLPKPMEGQTIGDVTAAEDCFAREIAKRHPAAQRPVVVGNCQGGWAAMLLAATNPNLAGAVVLNGAPLSYWAGVRGQKSLRYHGGLAGGALPALVASDLSNGVFDGANLVMNFESMNPGATLWKKYYNVFANVDTEAERFIDFERWWSGFYFMSDSEIRWIVENLFVGNRLERGKATLDGRGTVDLRRIKVPIIVFSSRGDDITPPQQALNWIPELYANEHEIRARGQRILYMVHDDVGHLGIFVSAKVARKEHDRIVSTLEAIEALSPGLYEMRIRHKTGEGINTVYVVDFEERTFDDLSELTGGRGDEVPFSAVARCSEFLVQAYEMSARPVVRALANPALAMALVHSHPLRARRYALSDINPAMHLIAAHAESARAARKPARADNPFVPTERLWAESVEHTLNFWRDVSYAAKELTFFALWSNPFMVSLAEPAEKPTTRDLTETLRELPQVQSALMNVARGGYPEAVIRMLILMAKSRGSVRQSRLERSNAVLTSAEPFRSMGEAAREKVIDEQTLIVDFDEPAAIVALPTLLATEGERRQAIACVREISGDISEMSVPTLQMLVRLHEMLELPPLEDDAAPTAPSAVAPRNAAE